jgi:hypothetical protein
MVDQPLIEIDCAGSPYEMGLAQGKWLKPHSQDALRIFINNPYVPRWLRYVGLPTFKALLGFKGLQVRNRNFGNIWRHSADQFERLRGIADGAGVSLSLLFGLMSIETMSATFHYVMGCTSLGIGKTMSKTGSPMIGYNHDFPEFLKDQLIVRRSRLKGGLASVQLTYSSISGAICGVNAAGLAITLNHAFSTEPQNDGVPPTLLVQQVLDHCKSTEEAVRLFERTKFSNGSITTIVDAGGDIAALELSQGRFGVRRPKDGLSLTLNAYQLPELKEIEVPQDAVFHPKKYPAFFRGVEIHRHNWERQKRFEKLLAASKKLDSADIKRLLSDHDEGEGGSLGTICRHHPTSDTIASAVLHPKQGLLEAKRGFACGAQYREFRISP